MAIGQPLTHKLRHDMRAIPDDNLGYPVLITFASGGTGSGFYLNDGDNLHLATARHVILNPKTGLFRDNTLELLSYGKDPGDTSQTKFTLDLPTLAADHIRSDAQRDLAVVRLGKFMPDTSVSLSPGVALTRIAQSGIVGVHKSAVRKFADVMVANAVITFGYPVSLGLKHVPQISYERPLLRRGIVAGKNEQYGTLILDCPVYPGNSGGLVLEIEEDGLETKLYAIGLALQFVPAVQPWFDASGNQGGVGVVNSGYSIAAPIDAVLDLMTTLP
jgi:trypsin-like peptidase